MYFTIEDLERIVTLIIGEIGALITFSIILSLHNNSMDKSNVSN